MEKIKYEQGKRCGEIVNGKECKEYHGQTGMWEIVDKINEIIDWINNHKDQLLN